MSAINSVKGGFALSRESLSCSCQSPLLEMTAARRWVRALGTAPLALITPIPALATTRPASIKMHVNYANY